MYRNSEGYPDETAGTALANIEREKKEKKKDLILNRNLKKQVSK